MRLKREFTKFGINFPPELLQRAQDVGLNISKTCRELLEEHVSDAEAARKAGDFRMIKARMGAEGVKFIGKFRHQDTESNRYYETVDGQEIGISKDGSLYTVNGTKIRELLKFVGYGV